MRGSVSRVTFSFVPTVKQATRREVLSLRLSDLLDFFQKQYRFVIPRVSQYFREAKRAILSDIGRCVSAPNYVC